MIDNFYQSKKLDKNKWMYIKKKQNKQRKQTKKDSLFLSGVSFSVFHSFFSNQIIDLIFTECTGQFHKYWFFEIECFLNQADWTF